MIDLERKLESIKKQREQSIQYYRENREERLEYQAEYRRAQREGAFISTKRWTGPRKRRYRYSKNRKKKS